MTDSHEAPVTFTAAGFALGIRRSLPLQIGMIPFGLVVGVTAQAQGLSVIEALLMSGLVVAGASQLVVLGAWAMPVSLVSATLTCFVMNLRFGLMGPTLAPWLDKVHGWKRWGSIYLLMDHVWALSLQELARGGRDAAFMLGIGVVSWIIWVICTVLGFVLGEAVHPAAGHPLFFAALAAFIAMLVPMWRGARRDLLPWVAAAFTAIGVSKLLPETSWHIVAGAVVGGVTGYLRDRKRDADAGGERGGGAGRRESGEASSDSGSDASGPGGETTSERSGGVTSERRADARLNPGGDASGPSGGTTPERSGGVTARRRGDVSLDPGGDASGPGGETTSERSGVVTSERRGEASSAQRDALDSKRGAE